MDVTIEERHTDTLEITAYPVENGATISDHAYKLPMEVTIVAGKGASGGESVPKETYDALLELQKKREPFDIITGKRLYKNMLIKSLSTITDEVTENVLMVTAECKEVVIVETKTVKTRTGGYSNKASAQKQAKKTQPVQNGGTKQASAVQKESILHANLGS